MPVRSLSLDSRVLASLFNAVDVDRTGQVDFKNFAYALGVLKNGTMDQRTWLAFRAYDLDHDNFINKNELASLLRDQGTVEEALWRTVETIFSSYDYNRDSLMTYEEFKSAVLNNVLILQSFWTQGKSEHHYGFYNANQW